MTVRLKPPPSSSSTRSVSFALATPINTGRGQEPSNAMTPSMGRFLMLRWSEEPENSRELGSAHPCADTTATLHLSVAIACDHCNRACVALLCSAHDCAHTSTLPPAIIHQAYAHRTHNLTASDHQFKPDSAAKSQKRSVLIPSLLPALRRHEQTRVVTTEQQHCNSSLYKTNANLHTSFSSDATCVEVAPSSSCFLAACAAHTMQNCQSLPNSD